MAALRNRPSNSALALEFLILTAARSGEVYGATWAENVDDVWVVPKERMKAKREHRVPLSKAALDVLTRAGRSNAEALIFPGSRLDPDTMRAKPLSIMAMAVLLRKMEGNHIVVGSKRRAATPHGFRSSFRDWAGSETEYPRELAEEALAHLVGNAVERAYRRGDSVRRRRAMMEDWSRYVTVPLANRPTSAAEAEDRAAA